MGSAIQGRDAGGIAVAAFFVVDVDTGASNCVMCWIWLAAAGRHAIWLAERDWSVTAVDGSAAGIESLRKRSEGLSIKAVVADLEKHEYSIAPWGSGDLILISLYPAGGICSSLLGWG